MRISDAARDGAVKVALFTSPVQEEGEAPGVMPEHPASFPDGSVREAMVTRFMSGKETLQELDNL
jgi:hypothetical protein